MRSRITRSVHDRDRNSTNGEAMISDTVDPQLLAKAYEELRSALDLLDRASAPAQIGAHADLALHQLRSLIQALAGHSPDGG